MKPVFPKMRDDGSVAVAARYSFAAPDAVEGARLAVSAWVAEREAQGIDLKTDLERPPYIQVHGGTLDIVFDGRPGMPLWKDWMVSVCQQVASVVPLLTFVSFFDLVGGMEHPGSRHDAAQ
jgi:hypothetical protein